jgi:hypothetical protein
MSEPTREQLIQQANLRADYNEAKARGERWEMEKRPWGCEEWTTMLLGTSPAWCPEYEYRRTPEPTKLIEGWVVVHAVGGHGTNLYGCHAIAHKCNPSADRIVHLREVDPDTVTVPRAVVQKLLGFYCNDPGCAEHELRRHLDKLAEAVKGGA